MPQEHSFPKRFVALAVGLLAFAGIASADQLGTIKQRGSLVCATLGTAEPFSFSDPATREIRGYDVDFCKAVADSLGVKLELKLVAVEARIPELSQGRVDIVAANLGYSPQRAEQIDFSHQYFVSQQKIMVRTGDGIRAFSGLNGKRISAPKGSSSEQAVKAKVPGAELLTFQDPPSAFVALLQGKVDGFALSELASTRFMRQVAGKTELMLLPESMMAEPWGLGVRKGEPALLKHVNDTLAGMERSGEAAKIFDKWLGPATLYKSSRDFSIGPIATASR
ncbi:ABC transporter substrate-binding protein [Variovorax guangxiensis]|uniref:ABC transporter substrate-binding protein n=1 Tax=Variovorax guangxiensis TaxID=1775474 RepID=UPI0028630AE1|nr:ABC transporter substrate-binding protein [Variovorax guangxiensis]MDR6855684.1 polar amino acid transport system substrate-binding protein [Variovorax guangxiensis]